MHDVTWSSGPVTNGSEVLFWGIEGTRQSLGGLTNVTVDDTYAKTGAIQIEWQAAWTHLENGQSSSLSELSTLGGDFNKTISVTQTSGASMTFSAAGYGIYLYGMVGPGYGSASVQLDGQTVAPSLNLTAPWDLQYELLWFMTGLDETILHNVTMTNLEDSKMSMDFVIVSADSNTLSSISALSSKSFATTLAGKLVFFLVIPVVVLFGIGLLLWYLCGARRKKRTPRWEQRSQKSGLGHPPQPGRRSFERGDGYSIHSTPTGIIFIPYNEAGRQGHNSHPLGSLSPGSSRGPGSSGRSGTSDYSHSGSDSSKRARTLLGNKTHGSEQRSPWSLYTGSSSARSDGTRAPRRGDTTLPALPESVTNLPLADGSTNDSWSRPLRSLLGSTYTHSSSGRSLGRQPSLPPYTPGANGTYDSYSTERSQGSGGNQFASVMEEKQAQFKQMLIASGNTNGGISGAYGGVESLRGSPSREPHTSPNGRSPPKTHRAIALERQAALQSNRGSMVDSEAMSVYGQPPSQRDSVLTNTTDAQGVFAPLRPPIRPTPKVDTNFQRRQGGPDSALSSGVANSADPLLSRAQQQNALTPISSPDSRHRQDESSGRKREEKEFGESHRNHSQAALSHRSAASQSSAARPDSDIIPFETFIHSVRSGQ